MQGSVDCSFTVSARGKDAEVSVFGFLRRQFGFLRLSEIDSLFGFVEHSTLYGGRPFRFRELSDRDVIQLNNAGIGVRLPLSNHAATPDEYQKSHILLEKYHRRGNSVIVTNDELARWIRRDFPLYRVDASVIKNIDTHAGIDKALEIYDEVVLPMNLTQDFEFLGRIDAKERIILFANAGCALTCPSRICYPAFSKLNKGEDVELRCSQGLKPREILGMVDFDLEPLIAMGFRQFKLLRPRPSGMTGF
ncbi:MAG: hypothetical protein HYY36_00180 [Gammaproteobacteria bacterium]|nr:hypothetical protein [Gammaproteobacteria bacterium]